MLLIGALALSGFLIVDGVHTLWLSEPEPPQQPATLPPREPERAPELAQPPPPPHVATVRKREASQPDAAVASAPDLEPVRPAECDASVRISGTAYLRPGAGAPLVMFSGPDVRQGLRSVGGRVAGKTVAAIYPEAVILRDAAGRDCWLKMSSEHARDVVDAERRANAKRLVEERREKKREARRKRAAERRAKKASKR